MQGEELEQGTTNPTTAPMIGMSEETRGAGKIPFEVTEENKFNKAALTDVYYKEQTNKKKPSEKYDTLNFVFESGDGTKRHVESMFAVLKGSKDGSYTAKDFMDWQNGKIKQIFETYLPMTAERLALIQGTTWKDYYEKLEKLFKTGGANGKEVYKNEEGKLIPVWLKLTYGKTGDLAIPFGNFIEKIRLGDNGNSTKPNLLAVDKKDVFTQPKQDAAVVNTQKVNTDDLPAGF